MKFERINPVTNQLASTATAMTAAEACAVADRAARGFAAWSVTGPTARRACLMKAAAALEARKDDFVQAMMAEIGATAGWAMFNLMLAANMVREAAAITTQISGEVIPSDKPGCLAMALREPVGVVLGIAPWNAPIILGVRAIAVPLACGNSVILKASETCPRTHELIVEAFAAAGFPPTWSNVVTNAPQDAAEVVGALIDHPAVSRINFTGSTAVGRIVARRAAETSEALPAGAGRQGAVDRAGRRRSRRGGEGRRVRRLHESGPDLHVDRTDHRRRCGGRQNSPSASRPRRSRCRRAIRARARRRWARWWIARPSTHVNALIDDALGKGGKVIAGGKADSVLMPATVVDGVTAAMKLYRDESFGPVVAVIRARDEADAVRLANDSEYGLSAAVFTRDTARGLRVARQIRSGICHVNGPTVHDEAQMPFGGVGASGYGRFGGKAGIDQFTELRWITMETCRVTSRFRRSNGSSPGHLSDYYRGSNNVQQHHAGN